MRRRLTSRYIPKDAETFNHPTGLGVCYLVVAGRGFQVLGYGGKRSNPDFNNLYKTREQAIAKIQEYFKGLDAHAEFKARMRQAQKNRVPDPSKPTLAETAQLVRECLSDAFPTTKFSVRSDSYSMGCSIRVRWTDGPTSSQVDKILNAFERCGFDGMQDLKTYNGPSVYKGHVVEFGADYVQGQREHSVDLMKKAALRVAFECDLPLLKINDNGSVEGGDYRVEWSYYNYGRPGEEGFSKGDGEWYAQLIYQVACNTSLEAGRKVELPKLVGSKVA